MSLQDLLALLEEQGPSMEGIFWLVASKHISRELRETFDSGVEECSKPHLEPLALQDFVRNIPAKLLQNIPAKLLSRISALQKTSRQEKLTGLRKMANKLLAASFLLLKHLLGLLLNISKNSATSRMTASNLAICVGPNLLSPAEEPTLPLEVLMQVTGKVKGLVQFLIENSEELFGEEMAGLSSTPDKELPAPVVEAETAEALLQKKIVLIINKRWDGRGHVCAHCRELTDMAAHRLEAP
ncbi:hypothetical protein QYF61_008276 [Mycteria americana]|uniref:Rho-GAP domain-containing protein n=1 Tax=Mycteria americana TaxID=33587 RepID=A0AAN7SIY6_MYCAM|nr:hypothetical protein QYF61_008276 [Mycteria americana]